MRTGISGMWRMRKDFIVLRMFNVIFAIFVACRCLLRWGSFEVII